MLPCCRLPGCMFVRVCALVRRFQLEKLSYYLVVSYTPAQVKGFTRLNCNCNNRIISMLELS